RVRRSKHLGVERNLRDRGVKHADQGAVWRSVALELTRLDAANASGSLVGEAGIQQVLERDRQLAGAIEELARRGPLPGQSGVVVAHGSRVVAAELFA